MTTEQHGTAPAPKRSPDGRSRQARRFRALVAAFARDLGDDLSEADRALIQSAALAAMRIETLRSAILSGGDVDDERLTRLLNSTTRILSTVAGKSRRRAKRKVSLDEYLKGGGDE